ncbi:toll/interleukin-1 receptor domain-containing protein [Paenibacillus daejeonensis]|uniref:toll/interleukin-1 receptor domain-containing protein n=1 Tax=Paenibacillus daejeonensis TaxID=135193 RepID=UPI000369B2AE|nr:toll/interleukin-1 receptor domain-containing protein [Paenibacillus daejeonensis]
MKIFISWSGGRSKAVGDLLDSWLQCVIQAIDPWMSTKDIDRGAIWFSEINNQLKDTSVGIVILTKENKERPWIMFEAGALAKGLATSRIIVLLVDLENKDVRDPLAQFNLTEPNRDGMWQLVRTLNASLQDKALKEKVLEQVFDTYWPQFETSFSEILNNTPENAPSEPISSTDDVLNELLMYTRNINLRLNDLEKERTIDSNTYNYLNASDLVKMVSEKFPEGFDDITLEKIRKSMNKDNKKISSSPYKLQNTHVNRV